MIFKRCSCPLIILWLFSGCTNFSYWQGQSLLKDGKYLQSLQKFTEAEAKHPEDFRLNRSTGIVYFKLGEYNRASYWFKKTHTINPADELTSLYLGMIYEKKNAYDSALAQYRHYDSKNHFSSVKGQIKSRIAKINKLKIEQEVKDAIWREKEKQPLSFPTNTVGVLYFQNVSKIAKWDFLLKGIAELIAIDLTNIKSLEVVERQKLQQLVDNLAIEHNDMFDPATVPRCGRLLGASTLIMGVFTASSDEQIHISAMPISTATGAALCDDIQVNGDINDLFHLEKRLILSLVENMEIQLTIEEREAILQVPTTNINAFLKFCQGLDFEDKGFFKEARTEFEQAVSIDHDFEIAKDRIDELDMRNTIGELDIPQFENAIFSEIGKADSRPVDDRLLGNEGDLTVPDVGGDTHEITTRGPEEIPTGTLVIKGKIKLTY